MPPTGPARSPGFVGSLRALCEGVLAGVQDRLGLLSIELQEEKFRVVQTLIWIGALFFASGLALAFASLALVYLFWESARLAVLAILAGGYAVTALALALGFRRFLARQPRPFQASLEELDQDRTCIRKDR